MNRLSLLPILLLLFVLSCSKDKLKPRVIDNPYYDTAYDYREKQNYDSAYLYYNKAKDIFFLHKDSLGIGKCLSNMAIIATDKGDYYSGQELSMEATSYFNKNIKEQHVHIKANFNNLGIATYKLKDFENALSFFNSAISFSDNPLDTRIYLNNKAKIFQQTKNYDEALKIYQQILTQTVKNRKEYARALTNISVTKSLKDSSFNSLPNLLKALAIRQEENDLSGQNSSYAHLTDYYLKKKSDSALFYALKMYEFAKKINITNDKLQAIQQLIKLSPPQATKQYFEIYKKLSDSAETELTLSNNKFALIRYETEKQKADNLILQTENTSKRYQLFTLLTLSIIALGTGLLWYKRRKKRLELEAESKIRENQLKTSKKVHDVVANGLYRVMTEIENQTTIDREGILDKLENMYEKSRDISYDKQDISDQSFHDKITHLLESFVTENTKIVYMGNTENLWGSVNLKAKNEVEQILQELLVNMKKHSKASNVFVKFMSENNNIYIFYTDDGVGIKGDVSFNNGLTNTGNRINGINGTITFDNNLERGLKIQISFPLS